MAEFAAETTKTGEFTRQPNRFTHRITSDGSSAYPVEAGRYRLVVSLACPWAHRSIIVRRLLGLEQALPMAVVDPIRDERGWRFTLDTGGKDPVLGISFLSEAYHRADPDFEGRYMVPCIVDTQTGAVVTNDYPQISIDLSTQWTALHRRAAPNLYPEELRTAIDAVNAEVFRDVNNGVYRCGFATSQGAYETAYDALFRRLDALSEHLADREFLVGEQLSEADIRLFTTLVRFDAVYHGHFKCNRNKLTEMPVLMAYAKRLFAIPEIGSTVDFDQIKRHYYGTHPSINPTGIVPVGPDVSGWTS